MRVVVAGHVEWVQFLPVDRPPAPGAILRAASSWEEPAGGGGVAAAVLARLAGRCVLVTALGDDAVGQGIPAALGRVGVDVIGPTRPEPHRRALTWIDPSGERTITVVGPAQEARGDELDPAVFDGADAVYFCKGDADLLRLARRARVLVATARVLPILREAGVTLDALVRSASDPAEAWAPGALHPAPALVASTEGERGGAWWAPGGGAGRWEAAPVPGPLRDAYGAGDSFAAALTHALAAGAPREAALRAAAAAGAAALAIPGAGVITPSWAAQRRDGPSPG